MKKITTEIIIERFKKAHGDRYDYSLVEYVNSKTKVKIICPKHGEFEQTPNNHLNNKNGCPSCGIKSIKKALKKSKDDFAKEARKIHGNKYDYSSVEYKNAHTKVKIICPKHGEFEQTPNKHLYSKYGCPSCGIEARANNSKKTTKEFIKEIKKIHGNKYDYSLVDYQNAKTRVKLICPEHGVFTIFPGSLLRGSGCFKCGRETTGKAKKYTTKIFIEKAKEVHGDLYDYSLVDYKRTFDKVKIICPKHGEFEQAPYAHLSGKGCPSCSSSRGEKEIQRYLTENNIAFETQKTFEGCVDVALLRFDFYLPDHNLCIEFDGIQHFEPVDAFGGEENFIDRQRKDLIKEAYLKENSIDLLRISYLENIEEVLSEALGIHFEHSRNNLDPSYSLEERIREFELTLETKGDYMKVPYSNKLVLSYQPHFYEAEKKLWKKSETKEFIFNNRKKYLGKEKDELTDREILRAFKISGIHYGFSHFSPFWIKKFIEDFGVKSIYDPCGGWGHRLLGAWEIDYYYNDIDERTYNGVVGIYEELKNFEGGAKKFFNEDASSFSPDVSYEAVFTCPPYFDTEEYTWENTSVKKYPDYSDWLNVWWRNVVKKTNPSKYFAFVISRDYKDDMTKVVEEEGYRLIGEVILGKSKSHYTSGNNEFLMILETT